MRDTCCVAAGAELPAAAVAGTGQGGAELFAVTAARTGAGGAELLAATGNVDCVAVSTATATGVGDGDDINKKAKPPATTPSAMAR